MIYREALDDLGRLLVLAIRGGRGPDEVEEIERLVVKVGIDRLRAAARANQVEALVGVGLREAGTSPGRPWDAEIAINEERVTRLAATLASVVERLSRAGVASAAIEAGGVMLGSDLPLRAYCPGDIDLLVDEAGWEHIPSLLRDEGFHPADRRQRPTRRIEFRQVLPDNREQWIEIGCRPFDRAWVPLAVEDRSQAWLARRVPSRKDARIAVLDPADALALATLHTSLHSFVRAPGLRLHVDADRLVRDCAVDWERFAGEVRAARCGRRAFVSLSMARGLLGTPVPDSALKGLHPGDGKWRAIERLLSSEGTVETGEPKLRGVGAIRLDRLLDERGTMRWLSDMVAPPADWMREHFDRKRTGASAWRLHARRGLMLLTQWRPR